MALQRAGYHEIRRNYNIRNATILEVFRNIFDSHDKKNYSVMSETRINKMADLQTTKFLSLFD